eukprot:scaffold34609_cov146-Amphora_coffeaeformis.AAC.12
MVEFLRNTSIEYYVLKQWRQMENSARSIHNNIVRRSWLRRGYFDGIASVFITVLPYAARLNNVRMDFTVADWNMNPAQDSRM